jgi:hypothetical protein
MDDDFPNIGRRINCFPDLASSWRRGRFEGVKGTKKIKLLSIFILVLSMRLFFYIFFNPYAQAYFSGSINLPSSEVIDPMAKIGKSMLPNEGKPDKICQDGKIDIDFQREFELGGEDIGILLAGYPIQEMAGKICEGDQSVGAFLIGIAKKESDWGKHSPQKNGRNCYNYWGFKGSYNLTESGYSCFDSPDQAVEIVGGKIKELINKNINTPERMVVWKCGSSCSGHDPLSVRKWISDVSKYYYQFSS